MENAARIAAFLDEDRERLGIERLICQGRPDHLGYDISKREMNGFGSMITFTIAGGQARANKVAQELNLFAFAVSLGGFESLVQHPASMTHKIVPPERRVELGVDDNLLRLSVGIENADDLIADLDRVLSA